VETSKPRDVQKKPCGIYLNNPGGGYKRRVKLGVFCHERGWAKKVWRGGTVKKKKGITRTGKGGGEYLVCPRDVPGRQGEQRVKKS